MMKGRLGVCPGMVGEEGGEGWVLSPLHSHLISELKNGNIV
jgi:hypothetical protein